MRNFIFIYFLSGFFCLASSCGDRKTSEEQVNTTSSAEKIPPEEKAKETSSDNLKQDSLKNSLTRKSSGEGSEVSDTTEYSEPAVTSEADGEPEADDPSEASEIIRENDNESLTEKEELKGVKQEAFAAIAPELSEKIVHELPSKAAVGIKSYPNSYIIKLNNKTKYRDKFYVTMELVSSDTPEQVLNFYQKWRENWFYIENSAVHTFKKDKDKYFRETNTLQILPFDKNMYREIDSLLSFDAQTLIRIYYELPAQ
jgi:hypothetical protein